MTATTNGWPCKPGVPLNPKQNGAHKIGRYFLIWRADTQDYVNHNGNVLPPEVACALPYLGPVMAPDEATALQARVAGLEATIRDIVSKGYVSFTCAALEGKKQKPGWVCPNNTPWCVKNCGNYGCGN